MSEQRHTPEPLFPYTTSDGAVLLMSNDPYGGAWASTVAEFFPQPDGQGTDIANRDRAFALGRACAGLPLAPDVPVGALREVVEAAARVSATRQRFLSGNEACQAVAVVDGGIALERLANALAKLALDPARAGT